MQLLARGIEHGLTVESDDPGQSAGDHVMTLAVGRPINTPQEDLLGLAEHTAALADIITWVLRPLEPWKHPEAVYLEHGKVLSMQGGRGAGWAEDVPVVPRGVHAGTQTAHASNRDTANENELSELRQHISEEGLPSEAAVSGLRERQGADASSRLQQAAGSGVAVSPMPSKRAQRHLWEPEAFLGPGNTLRRVVLCNVWNEQRLLSESFDWRTMGDPAIYGMPITLIVIVLGASRDGRWHGPLSKAHRHPVSKQIRFKKRDDTPFGGTWNHIFRENYNGERDDWVDSMTEDGVLGEAVNLVNIAPSESADIADLAHRKLDAIAAEGLPDPQLSQCYDPIRTCQFRSCCPYFRMPSRELGFRSVAAKLDLIPTDFLRARRPLPFRTSH